MIQPRIVVIRPPENQNTDFVIAFELFEQKQAAALHFGVESIHRDECLTNGEVAFVPSDLQPGGPGLEYLSLQVAWLGQRNRRVDEFDPGSREVVDLLGKRRPYDFR